MTDNEDTNNHEKEKQEDLEEPEKEASSNQDKEGAWTFCPGCGTKLPLIKNLRFCTSCGLDLIYLKEHKELPPIHQDVSYNQPVSQYGYPGTYMKYGSIEKIPDEEITKTKDRKLWGTLPSIGLPLLAFVVMNLSIIVVVIALMFIIWDTNLVYAIIGSTWFIIGASVVEIILIIFPLWYIGRYLERPTLKNKLKLLGFSREGYDNQGVLKEVLLGLAFAGIGIFIVLFTSIAVELILNLFGVTIIRGDSPSNDLDYVISAADIFAILLLVVIMITVVGFCEELLFRGFMQKGLVRTLGKRNGIFLTALIFALIHLVGLIFLAFFVSPIVLLILFLVMFAPYISISLMLGYLFEWRNENLIACIITHGVYNSITVIIAFTFYLSLTITIILMFIIVPLVVVVSLLLYYYLEKYSSPKSIQR